MESIVGYPKDVVSQKLLKKDVLFGEEARQKRLSLVLHRPLEHGVLKFNADGGDDSEAHTRQVRTGQLLPRDAAQGRRFHGVRLRGQ